jgi:hypothetical protein
MTLSLQQIALLNATIDLCGGYDTVRQYINEKNAEISIIWSVEDVIAQANERHIPMTYDQAYATLQEIAKNHDSTIGINWDVIDAYINNATIGINWDVIDAYINHNEG